MITCDSRRRMARVRGGPATLGARGGRRGANGRSHGVDERGVQAVAQLADAARHLVELDLLLDSIALGHIHGSSAPAARVLTPGRRRLNRFEQPSQSHRAKTNTTPAKTPVRPRLRSAPPRGPAQAGEAARQHGLYHATRDRRPHQGDAGRRGEPPRFAGRWRFARHGRRSQAHEPRGTRGRGCGVHTVGKRVVRARGGQRRRSGRGLPVRNRERPPRGRLARPEEEPACGSDLSDCSTLPPEARRRL